MAAGSARTGRGGRRGRAWGRSSRTAGSREASRPRLQAVEDPLGEPRGKAGQGRDLGRCGGLYARGPAETPEQRAAPPRAPARAPPPPRGGGPPGAPPAAVTPPRRGAFAPGPAAALLAGGRRG